MKYDGSKVIRNTTTSTTIAKSTMKKRQQQRRIKHNNNSKKSNNCCYNNIIPQRRNILLRIVQICSIITIFEMIFVSIYFSTNSSSSSIVDDNNDVLDNNNNNISSLSSLFQKQSIQNSSISSSSSAASNTTTTKVYNKQRHHRNLKQQQEEKEQQNNNKRNDNDDYSNSNSNSNDNSNDNNNQDDIISNDELTSPMRLPIPIDYLRGKKGVNSNNIKKLNVTRQVEYLGIIIDIGSSSSSNNNNNYYSISWLKRLIDILYILNYNLIQLRFSNDYSFNIQLKSIPNLAVPPPPLPSTTSVTTKYNNKNSKKRRKHKKKKQMKPYTSNEIKELVQYAKHKNISIIPDFNMPFNVGGWAAAATATTTTATTSNNNNNTGLIVQCTEYICSNQLGRGGGEGGSTGQIGTNNNDGIPFNTFHPQFSTIIQQVLDEIIYDIFDTPPFIHLGYDSSQQQRQRQSSSSSKCIDYDGVTQFNSIEYEYNIKKILKNINYPEGHVIRWESNTNVNSKLFMQQQQQTLNNYTTHYYKSIPGGIKAHQNDIIEYTTPYFISTGLDMYNNNNNINSIPNNSNNIQQRLQHLQEKHQQHHQHHQHQQPQQQQQQDEEEQDDEEQITTIPNGEIVYDIYKKTRTFHHFVHSTYPLGIIVNCLGLLDSTMWYEQNIIGKLLAVSLGTAASTTRTTTTTTTTTTTKPTNTTTSFLSLQHGMSRSSSLSLSSSSLLLPIMKTINDFNTLYINACTNWIGFSSELCYLYGTSININNDNNDFENNKQQQQLKQQKQQLKQQVVLSQNKNNNILLLKNEYICKRLTIQYKPPTYKYKLVPSKFRNDPNKILRLSDKLYYNSFPILLLQQQQQQQNHNRINVTNENDDNYDYEDDDEDDDDYEEEYQKQQQYTSTRDNNNNNNNNTFTDNTNTTITTTKNNVQIIQSNTNLTNNNTNISHINTKTVDTATNNNNNNNITTIIKNVTTVTNTTNNTKKHDDYNNKQKFEQQQHNNNIFFDRTNNNNNNKIGIIIDVSKNLIHHNNLILKEDFIMNHIIGNDMNIFKLNFLQIRLVTDNGFVIELPQLKNLYYTPPPNNNNNNNIPMINNNYYHNRHNNGVWNPQSAKHIIEYAFTQNISVMPEISISTNAGGWYRSGLNVECPNFLCKNDTTITTTETTTMSMTTSTTTTTTTSTTTSSLNIEKQNKRKKQIPLNVNNPNLIKVIVSVIGDLLQLSSTTTTAATTTTTTTKTERRRNQKNNKVIATREESISKFEYLHLGSDERYNSLSCFIEAGIKEPKHDIFEKELSNILQNEKGISLNHIVRWDNIEQFHYPNRVGQITQCHPTTGNCIKQQHNNKNTNRQFTVITQDTSSTSMITPASSSTTTTGSSNNNGGNDDTNTITSTTTTTTTRTSTNNNTNNDETELVWFATINLLNGNGPWDIYNETRTLYLQNPEAILGTVDYLDEERYYMLHYPQRLLAFSMATLDIMQNITTKIQFQSIYIEQCQLHLGMDANCNNITSFDNSTTTTNDNNYDLEEETNTIDDIDLCAVRTDKIIHRLYRDVVKPYYNTTLHVTNYSNDWRNNNKIERKKFTQVHPLLSPLSIKMRNTVPNINSSLPLPLDPLRDSSIDLSKLHRMNIHITSQYLGVLLDAGRHYFPTDWLRRMIDILHKLNYNLIHFRLTDDQAFNVQLKSQPNLAVPVPMIHALGGGENKNTLTYTSDELKDLVQYAKQRNITMIPEINIPGHAAAWAGIEGLVVQCPKFICKEGYGLPLNVSHPKLKTILSDVLNEIIYDIFDTPPFVHLGGDEVHMAKDCFDEVGQPSFDYQIFENLLKDILKEIEYPEKQIIRWEITGDERNTLNRAGDITHWWYRQPGEIGSNEIDMMFSSPYFASQGLYFDTDQEDLAFKVFKQTRKYRHYIHGNSPIAIIAGCFELDSLFWYDRNIIGRLLAVALGASDIVVRNSGELYHLYETACINWIGLSPDLCYRYAKPILSWKDYKTKHTAVRSEWINNSCERLTEEIRAYKPYDKNDHKATISSSKKIIEEWQESSPMLMGIRSKKFEEHETSGFPLITNIAKIMKYSLNSTFESSRKIWEYNTTIVGDDRHHRIEKYNSTVKQRIANVSKIPNYNNNETFESRRSNNRRTIPRAGVILDFVNPNSNISEDLVREIIGKHMVQLGLNFLQVRLVNEYGFAIETPKLDRIFYHTTAVQDNFRNWSLSSSPGRMMQYASKMGISVMPEISISTNAGGWFRGGFVVACPSVLCMNQGNQIPNDISKPYLIHVILAVIHEVLNLSDNSVEYIHLGTDEREESLSCFKEAGYSNPQFDTFEWTLGAILRDRNISDDHIVRWGNKEKIRYANRTGYITQCRHRSGDCRRHNQLGIYEGTYTSYTNTSNTNTSYASTSNITKSYTNASHRNDKSPWFATVSLLDGGPWHIYTETRKLIKKGPIGILAKIDYLDEKYESLRYPQRLLAFAMGTLEIMQSVTTRVQFQSIYTQVCVLQFGTKMDCNVFANSTDGEISKKHSSVFVSDMHNESYQNYDDIDLCQLKTRMTGKRKYRDFVSPYYN